MRDDRNGDSEGSVLTNLPSMLSGEARNEAFKTDFQTSVGGLQPQIESLVRRVLDGRVIRPAEVASGQRGGMPRRDDRRACALA